MASQSFGPVTLSSEEGIKNFGIQKGAMSTEPEDADSTKDSIKMSKSDIVSSEDVLMLENVDNVSEEINLKKSDSMPEKLNQWSLNDATSKDCPSSPLKESKRNFETSKNSPTEIEDFGDQGQSCKDEDTKSTVVCRLCAVPCEDSALVFLFRHPPHHPEVLPKVTPGELQEEAVGDILSMIKATLPIKVSCCDKLPKQVCTQCVERLQLSYAFTTTVLKAESQLLSLRAQHKTLEQLNDYDSAVPYDCPVCREVPSATANQIGNQSSFPEFQGESFSWESIVIKDEPADAVEPSQEELEKSYNDCFGGQKDTEIFRMEERITLKPSKPSCLSGRRPRGRPRTRPPKVTPRGRRGRRSTQTTVEKILELSQTYPDSHGYGFRICSRENNPTSEALTQCLLCEHWFPGAAACLQHSLSQHMDCGAFLCPRCPRDDFPGDFELIQHFQETHCLDLELYEVYQSEKNDLCTQHSWQNEIGDRVEAKQSCEFDPLHTTKGTVLSRVHESSHQSVWSTETMEVDGVNSNALANELDESQDEVSSNISELAPRSLTSHSALYGEESNSISTPGSDSNLASEDILAGDISDQRTVQDELMCQPSHLNEEVSFNDSSCTVADFNTNLSVLEEESQDLDLEKHPEGNFCNANNSSPCGGNRQSLTNDSKAPSDDCHDSYDSLKADELCGFQEALVDKNQEVGLNGSTILFDSDAC